MIRGEESLLADRADIDGGAPGVARAIADQDVRFAQGAARGGVEEEADLLLGHLFLEREERDREIEGCPIAELS